MKLETVLTVAICWLTVCDSTGFRLDDLHEKTIMENVYNYMKGKGYVLDEIRDDIQSDDGSSSSISKDLAVAMDDLPDLYELIDILDGNEYDDDNSTEPVCASCRALMATLKTLAASSESWEEVRDLVVDVCKGLFDNNLTDTFVRVDVLCPGIVDLQGPHVYEILLPKYGKSPEDICRNLNSCLPPPDTKTKKVKDVGKKVTHKKKNKAGVNKKSLAERKREAVLIVQLADVHIEPKYQQGTDTECGLPVCCVPDYGPGNAGYHGDFNCNVPQSTMELFLWKIAELQPEFVIYSGDSPPHTQWEETYDSQLDCTARLVEALNRILGGYNVYPGIGNHEMYPTNLYSMEYLANYTGPMNVEFASMWSGLAGFTEENIETMETGGYYSLVVRPGLRILSFNTNYWYSFNWYTILHEGGEEIQGMFDFMRTSLEEARLNDEKVIIIGHHPPNSGDSLVIYTRMLEELMAEYGDLVVMHVSGHTHSDEFRVHSVDGVAVSTVWVSPTATARGKDPSMRLFYIDSDTLEVIDYERHGFSLADSIDNPEDPEIVFMYSAMEDYGLADMSPASWRDMIDRMETDDALLQRYYKNYQARSSNETCDESCRINHVCRSQFYSFDDNRNCNQEAQGV